MRKHGRSGHAHKGGLATLLTVREANRILSEKTAIRNKRVRGKWVSKVRDLFEPL